ncbi:MAG: DUF502 domain-containing protein [Alphaproteobacteria bacterium]|nr:DUF502 domain-containing protein [Alphaproteobacteria bacterium]
MADDYSTDGEKKITIKTSFISKLRNYFLTGVLVTAPAAITFFLFVNIIEYIDEKIGTLIPEKYNPETYLPFSIPGLGIVVLCAAMIFIGIFTAGFAGKALLNLWEKLIARIPVASQIFSTLKQIFETVLSRKSSAFRKVVLVEYPRKKLWAIGFVTSNTKGEIKEKVKGDMINIFLPTTPNPTSGFLLFVPEKEVIALDMTVEEGIKLVISGGIVTPEYLPIK